MSHDGQDGLQLCRLFRSRYWPRNAVDINIQELLFLSVITAGEGHKLLLLTGS